MHFFTMCSMCSFKFIGLKVWLGQKFKLKIKERAITQKIRVAKLCFLYIALLRNKFYQYMKFQVDSFYILEVMLWTKIQTENQQWAITQK